MKASWVLEPQTEAIWRRRVAVAIPAGAARVVISRADTGSAPVMVDWA
jgi:hypothetical protein